MLAREAGFDGIELLSQGGYLLHNFLCSYVFFVFSLYPYTPSSQSVAPDPSQATTTTAVYYSELSETYDYYIKQMMAREIGFINLSRRGCTVGRNQNDFFESSPKPEGKELPAGYDPVKHFGPLIKYPGSKTMLVVNHEYTVTEADKLVRGGQIDLVTFAGPFIYIPDLISRLKAGVAFSVNDRGGRVNYGPYNVPDENYNEWPKATCA
ncbi:hypothetical protein BBP40_005355 [Aspergillus hancockii]|nr:hypothetical protein BBP40_005355 [Aspergillus hancockii]